MRLSIVIPAYQPDSALVRLVTELAATPVSAVVVVNDGSGPECRETFDRIRALPKVVLLEHAVNLGKGMALKTGMNHAICAHPDDVGVVTADADGQHAVPDILRVAAALEANPNALVLGARGFSSDVPLRSRFGNNLTRVMMRLVVGHALTDTQTGLRGIPKGLVVEILRVPSTGYEFELDMLIACKHLEYPIAEVPIRTIYLEGNRSSHFNPLIDSMRIYFVLFRFMLVSLSTAIIDNLAFFAAFRVTAVIWQSLVVGRIVAVIFNYILARRAVFMSRQRHATTLPKYLLLVTVNALVSYALLTVLTGRFGFRLIWGKPLVESALFLANFAIQRDFIFVKSRTIAPAAG